MRTRSIPFWISAFIHLAVFGGAAIFLIRPPVFAVDAGRNSVEVSLVAAEPDPVPPPPPTPTPDAIALNQPAKPDDFVVPVTPPTPAAPPTPAPPVPTPPLPVVIKPKPHHIPTIAKGDGSAPRPGKDAITAQSVGGAILDAKPDYLSNPPPEYPEIARRASQEGVVHLQVIVSTDGSAETVTIIAGSGYMSLDQAAVAAVQKWRFRPATFGELKIRSRVQIPVRFRLDE